MPHLWFRRGRCLKNQRVVYSLYSSCSGGALFWLKMTHYDEDVMIFSIILCCFPWYDGLFDYMPRCLVDMVDGCRRLLGDFCRLVSEVAAPMYCWFWTSSECKKNLIKHFWNILMRLTECLVNIFIHLAILTVYYYFETCKLLLIILLWNNLIAGAD